MKKVKKHNKINFFFWQFFFCVKQINENNYFFVYKHQSVHSIYTFFRESYLKRLQREEQRNRELLEEVASTSIHLENSLPDSTFLFFIF